MTPERQAELRTELDALRRDERLSDRVFAFGKELIDAIYELEHANRNAIHAAQCSRQIAERKKEQIARLQNQVTDLEIRRGNAARGYIAKGDRLEAAEKAMAELRAEIERLQAALRVVNEAIRELGPA